MVNIEGQALISADATAAQKYLHTAAMREIPFSLSATIARPVRRKDSKLAIMNDNSPLEGAALVLRNGRLTPHGTEGLFRRARGQACSYVKRGHQIRRVLSPHTGGPSHVVPISRDAVSHRRDRTWHLVFCLSRPPERRPFSLRRETLARPFAASVPSHSNQQEYTARNTPRVASRPSLCYTESRAWLSGTGFTSLFRVSCMCKSHGENIQMSICAR